MLFKKLSGLSKTNGLSKTKGLSNRTLTTSQKDILEELFIDVSDALANEELAADAEIKVSTQTKTVGIIINNNKKININYNNKNEILNNTQSWQDKVNNAISNHISKSSFKSKYIVTIKEDYNLSDLNLLNVDITVNDVLSESNSFICYASQKDIDLLSLTNNESIEGAIPDEVVSIPSNEEPIDVTSISSSSINSYLKRIGADTSSRRIGTRNPDFDISKISNNNSPNPIRVFVLDTGIADDHPDININRDLSKDFTTDDSSDWSDKNGHGTHVAGTIGASDNSEVSGVAPNIELIAYKVLGNNGNGSTSGIFKAFDDVAAYKKKNPNAICIMNMSLSGSKGDNNSFELYCNKIKNLTDLGVLIIVAAGNDKINAFNKMPAAVPDVITVGAYDDTNNKLAVFSNFGAKVDILAPGVNIKNTWLEGGYKSISGTSMAAPVVTGAVVNMVAVSARNDIILDQQDVKKIIMNSGNGANKDSRNPNPLIMLTSAATIANTTKLSLYVGEYLKNFTNY